MEQNAPPEARAYPKYLICDVEDGMVTIDRNAEYREADELRAEIERLTERCAAYKGQVRDGSIVIDRLRAALGEISQHVELDECTLEWELTHSAKVALAALSRANEQIILNDPCHGPEDTTCPSCGLGNPHS